MSPQDANQGQLQMLIRELKRHFPARAPEWINAVTMFGWGAYVLLHPGIFNQPYLQGLVTFGMIWSGSPERLWGLVTVVVGMLRGCALFANGSYSQTPLIRLITSAVSAFIWAQVVIGIMSTGVPTLELILYGTALALDMLSAYRAACDAVIASETTRNPGLGRGKHRSYHSTKSV